MADPNDYNFNQNRYPDITTSKELADLRNARPVPAPQLNMPGPGGDIQREVDSDIFSQNEQRINFLEDSLSENSENLKADFDNAVNSDNDIDI